MCQILETSGGGEAAISTPKSLVSSVCVFQIQALGLSAIFSI